METLQIKTIPTYQNQPTDDPHLFRVVDREGNWSHYFQDELGVYLPAVNHIINVGFPKGAGLLSWMQKMSEEEAKNILESAGERGSKVHAAIRELIMGNKVEYGDPYENSAHKLEPLTASEWDYLVSWVEWAKIFKPQVLNHETAIWNRKHRFAGTVDFIGKITIPAGYKVYIDGKLTKFDVDTTIACLLDWKTSSGIHDNYLLQTSSYAGSIKLPAKGSFCTGVVRIGTKHQNGGFEMRLWSKEQTKVHFKHFLEVKNIFHWLTGKEDWAPDIEQIPTMLSVDVPIIKPAKAKGEQNNVIRQNKQNKK